MNFTLINQDSAIFQNYPDDDNVYNRVEVERFTTLRTNPVPVPGFRPFSFYLKNKNLDAKRLKLDSDFELTRLQMDASVLLLTMDPDVLCRIYPACEQENDNVLSYLEQAFGCNNLSFTATWRLCTGKNQQQTFQCDGLLLQRKCFERQGACFPFPLLIFSFRILESDKTFTAAWTERQPYTSLGVTLTCHIKEAGLQHFAQCKGAAVSGFSAVSHLLPVTVGPDTILQTENGARVPCHKSFLSVHSAVFRQMFESGELGDKDITVKLPERVTEEGVRAMLAFMYTGALEEVYQSGEKALELLRLASEYRIILLENEIQDLIKIKDKAWFSLPVTLELFQVAQKKLDVENAEEYKSVREKALSILKDIPYTEIQQCPDFKRLFLDQGTPEDLFSRE